jgi:hypothetical protein
MTIVSVPVRETDEWQARAMYRLTRDCVSVDSVEIEQQTDRATVWGRQPDDPHHERLTGDNDRVSVTQDSVVVRLGEDLPRGRYQVTTTVSARDVSVSTRETVQLPDTQ